MPQIKLEKINDFTWQIPKTYNPDMHVPAVIYADESLLQKMTQDRTLIQAVNVATLRGIYKYSVVLPDAHEGYGFCIGGVAAMDATDGVISPGGVGYDINCGVRLLVTNLDEKDVRPKLQELMTTLFNNVPSGLGSRRKDFKVTHSTLDRIAIEGAKYIIDNYGLGWSEDIKHIEEEGAMDGADPNKVSPVAKDRGMAQIGTLGSGNHFLEVQRVDKIFDREIAKAFGITHENQITVMIHTGSRGYGHQICSDYLKVMERAIHRYNIKIPDRELACAPASSPEAEQYFSAMACAVNYAFANRQAITHWVRQSFERVFNTSADKLGMKLVYDVAHNIAKLEEHRVNGERKKVYVHRKGATRAFPPNHPQIPADYRSIGQPVIIPGSMGTASWLLIGTEKAMDLSFGSTAHGAGREMSRAGAKRQLTASYVEESLRRKGIVARAASKAVLVEEADESYKNVDKVVEVSHNVGIALKVARLVPIGVAKG